MITEYVVSLDLGQVQDHTALAIIGFDPGGTDRGGRQIGSEKYQILWLEHYPKGTKYRDFVAATKKHLSHPDLVGATRVLIDRGEVGKAVIEMFQEEGISPRGIQLTSGNEARKVPGGYNVPKKDVVFALYSAYAQGRIIPYDAKPGTAPHQAMEKLKAELLKFKMKMTKAGNQQFEAETEGDHDDIVMAVAMAVWYLREYGQDYEGLLEKEQTEWDPLKNGL